MMEIRNLTPHAIHVLGEDSQVVLTLPASGVVARAATSRSCVGAVDVDGVAVPVNAPPLSVMSLGCLTRSQVLPSLCLPSLHKLCGTATMYLS